MRKDYVLCVNNPERNSSPVQREQPLTWSMRCLRHQHRECVHNAPKKNNIWRCKPCIDMRRKLKEGHQNEATTPFSLAHWLPRSFSIAMSKGHAVVMPLSKTRSPVHQWHIGSMHKQ
eukprot:m.51211 g.51211  ORF g.51211 m.51211 type:complete len:117 (-) comp7550_c0_seq3:876-1226(-)